MYIKTPGTALKFLWSRGFFRHEKGFAEILDELSDALGCHPSKDAMRMALNRANFLTKKKDRYVQRHTPRDIALSEDAFPKSLIAALGNGFDIELKDLRLNFGQSGTCTAFLLRKILEKLIYITFAKNNLDDNLKEANGDFVGLGQMLKLAVNTKVNGTPFMTQKTKREIEGVKFLGDTSAHNPLANVDMQTIIPQMPYIITAYEELSKKL